MADIFNKITEGINTASAIGSALGLKSKSKNLQRNLTNNPRNKIGEARANGTARNEALAFPEDLADRFFCMTFKAYSGYQTGNRKATPITSSAESICLPFPKELKQSYNVEWSSEEVGPFVGEALDLITQKGMGETSFENMARGEFDEKSLAIAGRAGAALVKGAVSGVLKLANVKTALGLELGIAENPNDRALLRKVPLREHNFTWTLSPRNPNELAKLKKIVTTIRKKMYPVHRTFYLDYPYIVDIGFINSTDLAFYKPAAIKSFEVDMAPGGVSFFQGDKAEPVVYNLSLTVLELEPIEPGEF